MKKANSWRMWCMGFLACCFVWASATDAWARCRRGWRTYRAKSGRAFCCPPGTRGFYKGYRSIRCLRTNRRSRRTGVRRPTFVQAGRAGSISFSFNSLRANRAVRAVKKQYFYKKRCRVVGLYHGNARKFQMAAAHINNVIRSRGFSQAMYLHHRYYRRWERFNGKTRTILYHLQRRRWNVVINTFARTRRFPCYDDKANGHTNAFARLGVGFVLLSKSYLRRATVRQLARTVIHETLHTLRYSHRGLKPWTRPYNNTVPPFVGCLVKNWNRAAYSNANARARLVRYCTTGGSK